MGKWCNNLSSYAGECRGGCGKIFPNDGDGDGGLSPQLVLEGVVPKSPRPVLEEVAATSPKWLLHTQLQSTVAFVCVGGVVGTSPLVRPLRKHPLTPFVIHTQILDI